MVLKANNKFCVKCGKITPHNYVGSKGDFEGFGLARGILAVCSLGVSETLCRNKYWQCYRCGEVTKE